MITTPSPQAAAQEEFPSPDTRFIGSSLPQARPRDWRHFARMLGIGAFLVLFWSAVFLLLF